MAEQAILRKLSVAALMIGSLNGCDSNIGPTFNSIEELDGCYVVYGDRDVFSINDSTIISNDERRIFRIINYHLEGRYLTIRVNPAILVQDIDNNLADVRYAGEHTDILFVKGFFDTLYGIMMSDRNERITAFRRRPGHCN